MSGRQTTDIRLFNDISHPEPAPAERSQRLATGFVYPDKVASDLQLTPVEKREILASWTSDMRAVPDAPALRQLDNSAVVHIDDVLQALKSLNKREVSEHTTFDPLRSFEGLRIRRPLRLRLPLRQGWPDDDDDPPPCPATIAGPPGSPLSGGETADPSLALGRWGFTAQKPLRRAYEQSAEAVQRWLSHDYPAIAARAKREKGTIFWGDETGLRSDDVRGRSFAPRGRTPVVRPSQRRARIGLISAVTNKGELRWMLLDGTIKAPVLIRFMQRLVRDAGRKVFLVLDNLPVHRARAVQDWLARRQAEIEVFHLPAYSPELNPDKGLNADLKQAAMRKPPTRSRPDLKRNLIGSMRSLSKRPSRIRSYFGYPTFRYAA